MASGNAEFAYHSTLAAATADTVTLSAHFEVIRIINRSGAAEIYLTTDGTAVVGGAVNTFVVPAVAGATVLVPDRQGDANSVTVSLISSGSPTYSVIGTSIVQGVVV
jgi:hypothetical protein